MKMSFCRKSVHSFLGLNDLNCATNNNNYSSSSSSSSSFDEPKMSSSPASITNPCKHGLGLITGDTGDDSYRSPPNVIESSVAKLLDPAVAAPVVTGVFSAKKDPGGIGFIDEVGGGVDGLMSCTESLGFESSDERTVDDRIELGTRVESSPSTSTRAKWRKVGERRETQKFPPPLSSFNHHGQPSFFLLPVRKNGRLELTEVWIDRPEILRACREDGRLTLHLIRDADDFDSEFKEEEGEQNNQEILQEEEEEEHQYNEDQDEEEEEIEEEELTEEENHDEEEETVGEWKFPVTGEGFRRCNKPTVAPGYPHRHHHHHHHNMSHHHNLHVWGQHYVTTR